MECLEYRYCELFVKCYSIAKRAHEKSLSNLSIDNWIISKRLEWGRVGNLARDCIVSEVRPSVKYVYCNRHYRRKNFIKEAFDISGREHTRITLELIAHPCYCGFDKYVPLDKLPDNWGRLTDTALRHKLMKAASHSPLW